MARLLFAFFITLFGPLWGDLINQNVINIFLLPEDDTEINTQVIYGTSVIVVEDGLNGYVRVRTPDGEEGWIQSSQITCNDAFEQSDHLRPVKNLFANIYRVPDTSPFPPLLTIPYGAMVKLVDCVDQGQRWVPIELVSGERAWIQRGDVDFAPKPKTMEEVLVFSKRFLGLPYTWGGCSTYGFDCSGFVQMLYKEMGFVLPRNSRDMAKSPLLIPVARDELQPGDLVFFGESRITHVGLYLGEDEFIQCSVKGEGPTVKIECLQSTQYVYHSARRLNIKKEKVE